MKIWYQSMAREDSPTAYHGTVRKILERVKDPETELVVHGITESGGIQVQYRYLEYLETGEVMRNLHTAMRGGFDAFLIGNIMDPGLRECREIANIPVLGLCETSLHLACIMGANFSLISVNEKFIPRILENVVRYGLRSRLVAIKRMDVERSRDVNEGFSDEDKRQAHIRRFLDAADETVEAGAEVVIPAGGGAMTLLAASGIHLAARGTPILNGITALLKMGETSVKLNRIMGGSFTSKRLTYAPPGSAHIDEIRRYFGNIYPTVKGRSKAGTGRG